MVERGTLKDSLTVAGGEVDSAAEPSVHSARIGALPHTFAYAEPLATASFGTAHFLEGACR